MGLFGAVPLLGPFWINVVFPLVIQSGTCASCKHLFISSASLSWMKVNSLNQNPCIPSWPGVFQFDIFFVSFWVVRCLFPLSGFLRVLLVLSSYCLSIQPFRYAFLVTIFSSKIVRFLWRPVVGMFLCHALPIVDRFFFRCFGMSSFVCIVLPFVDISLISLLSPELSGLFPQVLLLFFLVLSFPFCSHIFQDLFVLTFWPVFVDFFCVSSRISPFWGDPNFLTH